MPLVAFLKPVVRQLRVRDHQQPQLPDQLRLVGRCSTFLQLAGKRPAERVNSVFVFERNINEAAIFSFAAVVAFLAAVPLAAYGDNLYVTIPNSNTVEEFDAATGGGFGQFSPPT